MYDDHKRLIYAHAATLRHVIYFALRCSMQTLYPQSSSFQSRVWDKELFLSKAILIQHALKLFKKSGTIQREDMSAKPGKS